MYCARKIRILRIIMLSVILTAIPGLAATPEKSEASSSTAFLRTLSQQERDWLRDHPIIRVAQDPDWPPVEFTNSRGEPSGMSRDYLKLVESRLGIKFKQIRNLSWQEAYARLKRWEIDMTSCVAATPARQKFWAFTNPYLEIPIVIATQPDVTYIAEMKELVGKKVAVVESYAVSDWIAKDYPSIQQVRVKTATQGLQLLQRGEVFAYIDNLLIVGNYLSKMKINNLKIAGQTPYVNAQCMAVRKDWPILAEILQKALASISEAERNDIYRKWLPVRYEHGFDYARFWLALSIFAVIILGLLLWIRKLAREILSRKKAEAALSESETKFRRLLEMMPLPLVYVSKEGKIVFRNERFVQVFGYTTDDVSTLSEWNQLAYPDPQYRQWVMETWDKSVRQAIEEKSDIDALECNVKCKSGETRIMAIFGITLKDEFLAVFIDLTEYKKKEAALIESDQRLSEAQKLAQLGHWTWNVKTGKVEWSEEMFNIFKLDPTTFTPSIEAILALSPWPVDHERDQTLIQAAMRNHEKGTYDQRFLYPDKSIGYYHSTFQGKYDTDGNLTVIFGTAMDITARKRAEEEREKLETQLRQAQKMESIGRLAGGVAHDFNNMLGVIIGRADIAIEMLEPDHPILIDLEEIRKAANRSADLTRQLLAFARKQTIAPKVLDLNEIVGGMLRMLQRLIGENIRLNWNPGSDLWLVKLDPSQIDQLLANLCVNARDAIADIGIISIETENRSFDAEYCTTHAEFMPGEYIQLTVSDTGQGMGKEMLDHIFEPFFTTKLMGKGTGLGLATVYGIVKQNNGFINVYSEPKHGTIFSIYLPRHTGSINDISAKESTKEPFPHGQGTIIVVEDEPALLKVTSTMLSNLGYTVLPAGTPDAAMTLALENSTTVDLLLSDVIMPEMNGSELAKKMTTKHPHIKCLFMSGYTANVIEHHGVLDHGVFFIQKPFSVQELSDKIHEVLADSTMKNS